MRRLAEVFARKRVVLAVLLASAAANAVLTFFLVSEGKAHSVTAGEAVGATPEGQGQPAAEARSRRKAPVLPMAPGSCPARLLSARARLHDRRSASPDQPAFVRSFDAAKAVEPHPLLADGIAAIFAASDLAGVPHELECRGQHCRLRVFEPEDLEVGDWLAKIQDAPSLRRRFRAAAATSGFPVEDSVSGDWLIRFDAYLEVPEAPFLAGVAFLEKLFQSFDAAGASAACRPRGEARGALDLQLAIDGPPPRVLIFPSGDLARTPVGACIAEALNAHVASVPVPEGATDGYIDETIQVR